MRPSIQDVKARHARRLLELPGVVSVGIGLHPGRDTIVIGLDRPRPKTQEQVPGQLEGYPVRAELIGEVKTQ